MGVKYECDGCGSHIEEKDIQKEGMYDHCYYGPCCHPAYEELMTIRDRLRQESVQLFENGWKEAKQTIKNLKRLRKLPDDSN